MNDKRSYGCREEKKKEGEKGFIQEELKKAGLIFKQTLKINLLIDTRRQSKYEENVKRSKISELLGAEALRV